MMGCSRYGDGSIGETQSSRRPTTPSIKPRYILMHTTCINTISAKSKYICSHGGNEIFAKKSYSLKKNMQTNSIHLNAISQSTNWTLDVVQVEGGGSRPARIAELPRSKFDPELFPHSAYVEIFVTFATKVPYLTFCNKMWRILM